MCGFLLLEAHELAGNLYETVVETEDHLVAIIIIAGGTIADMPGIFERMDDQWFDNGLRALQAKSRA